MGTDYRTKGVAPLRAKTGESRALASAKEAVDPRHAWNRRLEHVNALTDGPFSGIMQPGCNSRVLLGLPQGCGEALFCAERLGDGRSSLPFASTPA